MTVREGERQGPRSDQQREFLRADEGDRVRMLRGAQSIDPFALPPELLAKYPGMSFQWNAYEVFGRPDHRQRQFEEMQGWRAVPYSMFPGYFAPIGTPGFIVVKDMVLMERPQNLTDEARREEIARANQNLRINQRMAAEPTVLGPKFNPNGQYVTSARNPTNLNIPDD